MEEIKINLNFPSDLYFLNNLTTFLLTNQLFLPKKNQLDALLINQQYEDKNLKIRLFFSYFLICFLINMSRQEKFFHTFSVRLKFETSAYFRLDF